MKHILVTGGAGYIGSHICERFYREGFIPVTFDNLSKGNKWSVKWGPLEIGDLRDEASLRELFLKYSFIGVIHLAALSNVEDSNKEPETYYKNNLLGTLNLLQIMLQYKVHKLVFSSTAAVYGKPQYTPIDENHPTDPINCYGDTKIAVEKLIYNISHSSDLNFISLRYFNVSGSNYKKNIGEAHYPETHIIPLALQAALKNNYFNINGNNYQTPDGTCIRDYIHINDLCDAHLLSFKKLYSSNIKEFINIGAGRGFSVLEILKSVKKITGYQILTKIVKKRLGDPDILVSKIEKSNKFLSWKPKVSDINTIILDSWEWYKIHKSF